MKYRDALLNHIDTFDYCLDLYDDERCKVISIANKIIKGIIKNRYSRKEKKCEGVIALFDNSKTAAEILNSLSIYIEDMYLVDKPKSQYFFSIRKEMRRTLTELWRIREEISQTGNIEVLSS